MNNECIVITNYGKNKLSALDKWLKTLWISIVTVNN